MFVPVLKNGRRIMLCLFLFHNCVAMPFNPREHRRITQDTMLAASRSLTKEEYKLLADFIEQKLHEAQQEQILATKKTEYARLNKIFNDFYQHRYERVLQGISALGYNPQDILRTSKLRIAMLSGSLEHTLWILREIAGLDWFFERDAKRKRKDWPKSQDKLEYLMSLADELVVNHTKVFDPTLVVDAIDSLENHINQWQTKVSKTAKQSAEITLAKLNALRASSYAKAPADRGYATEEMH